MRRIKLTRGKFTKVDSCNFTWLNRWKWHAVLFNGKWYAKRWICFGGKQRGVLMHRLIIGLIEGEEGDHADGDGLNNQEYNLRKATRAQQCQNRKKFKNCSSQFKGVSWHKIRGRWQAYIGVAGKIIYLGLFDTEVLAARQYDNEAKKRFGKFAKLNFPISVA